MALLDGQVERCPPHIVFGIGFASLLNQELDHSFVAPLGRDVQHRAPRDGLPGTAVRQCGILELSVRDGNVSGSRGVYALSDWHPSDAATAGSWAA